MIYNACTYTWGIPACVHTGSLSSLFRWEHAKLHLKLQIPYFKLYSKNLTCYSTCHEIITSDLRERAHVRAHTHARTHAHTHTHHTQAVICPCHLKNETEFFENILLQNSTKICTTYDQYSFCTLKYKLHQRLIC